MIPLNELAFIALQHQLDDIGWTFSFDLSVESLVDLEFLHQPQFYEMITVLYKKLCVYKCFRVSNEEINNYDKVNYSSY